MELEYKFYLKSEEYLQKVLNSDFWNEFNSDLWSKNHLITRYFDTEDLKLSRNKFSLRIRKEDSQDVLTVKTPEFKSDNGELSCRGEWNFAWIEDYPDISFLLDSLENEIDNSYIELLESVKNQKLQADMTTDVVRYKKNVFLEKTQIEVVLDSGKLYGGDLDSDVYELEIELIAGDENKLFMLADLLKEKFELEPGSKSKMQRCFELLEKSRKNK